MKQAFTILLTVLLTAFGSLSTATASDHHSEETKTASAWTIDTAHSEVAFTIRHFFTPVRGTFEQYEADVYFDPENLEASSIDVTIQVASINTRNEDRDEHLQSDDFFNSEQWPVIRFTSNSIEQRGEEYVAVGTLTIRDVTTDYELPFTLLGVMDHPMRENTKVAGITANSNLNRNDYGVGTGSWAATAVVGGNVEIELLLELVTEG